MNLAGSHQWFVFCLDVLLVFQFHSFFQQAVRQGKWKAIRYGTKEPVRLYDLSIDADERNDVAGEHQDVAEKFARIMDASRVDTPYWPAREHARKKKQVRK